MPPWASRHIGGSWSIPTVLQRRKDWRPRAPQATASRKHDSNTHMVAEPVRRILTWYQRRFVETADLRSNDGAWRQGQVTSLSQKPKRSGTNRETQEVLQEVPQEIQQEIPQENSEKNPDNMFKVITYTRSKQVSHDAEFDGAGNEEVGLG